MEVDVYSIVLGISFSDLIICQVLNFEYQKIPIIGQYFFLTNKKSIVSVKHKHQIFITNSQYSLLSILTNLPKSCQVHKIRSTQYFFDLSFTEFQMGFEKENNFRKQSVSKFKVIKKYHHKNLRYRYLFSNDFSSKRLIILNI